MNVVMMTFLHDKLMCAYGKNEFLQDCAFYCRRSDKTLQDIVYKLVPGLFKSKSSGHN